jgi:hypothetical protein
MDKHHPTLPPSSFPMLEQCPCFKRGEDEVSMALEPAPRNPRYTNYGTMMHRGFEFRMNGKTTVLEGGLDSHDVEGLEWAVDFVRMNVDLDYPIELEQELVLMDDKFNLVTFGTGDVVNGPRLFDLKSGDYHNYWLQMAVYALMQMDRIGADQLLAWVLFSRYRKAHELLFTREEASKRIFAVVERVLDPDKKPKANLYCRWCQHLMTCSAVNELVKDGLDGKDAIEDPAELSRAWFNSKILQAWAERIQEYARQVALTGVELPNLYLKSRAGNRQIMDVKRAYELSGLPPDKFIALCRLSIGTLEDGVMAHHKLKKSAAKKYVNTQLGDVIQRGAPTVFLAPEEEFQKSTNEEKE